MKEHNRGKHKAQEGRQGESVCECKTKGFVSTIKCANGFKMAGNNSVISVVLIHFQVRNQFFRKQRQRSPLSSFSIPFCSCKLMCSSVFIQGDNAGPLTNYHLLLLEITEKNTTFSCKRENKLYMK